MVHTGPSGLGPAWADPVGGLNTAERSTWRIAASAASHRPSAQSPRIPASSYARSAASRQAARTASTTIDGVSVRCDIDPGAYHGARKVPTDASLQALHDLSKSRPRASYWNERTSSINQRQFAGCSEVILFPAVGLNPPDDRQWIVTCCVMLWTDVDFHAPLQHQTRTDHHDDRGNRAPLDACA